MISLIKDIISKFKSIEISLKRLKIFADTESVYFYTFHKCASTLFSKFILKNINNLEHINYAGVLYNKSDDFNTKLNFRRYGFIYGPIRISATGAHVKKLLVIPTSESSFIQDKNCIFFIRDPRDILVSKYYSFGFTHGLSPVSEKRREQLERRKEIQSLTINEYVLKYAEEQVKNFTLMKTLIGQCRKGVVLKYEDMIYDFSHFSNQLQSIVDIDQNVVNEIYTKSRPKENIDSSSHKRSGAPRRFEEELDEEVIIELNSKLKEILLYFNYLI